MFHVSTKTGRTGVVVGKYGPFTMLTGVQPVAFHVQIQAVENLLHTGVMVHPAVMVSSSTHHEIEELRNRLGMIDVNFKDVEIEELVMYGDVKKG